jgi:hypothetical protein
MKDIASPWRSMPMWCSIEPKLPEASCCLVWQRNPKAIVRDKSMSSRFALGEILDAAAYSHYPTACFVFTKGRKILALTAQVWSTEDSDLPAQGLHVYWRKLLGFSYRYPTSIS